MGHGVGSRSADRWQGPARLKRSRKRYIKFKRLKRYNMRQTRKGIPTESMKRLYGVVRAVLVYQLNPGARHDSRRNAGTRSSSRTTRSGFLFWGSEKCQMTPGEPGQKENGTVPINTL